MDMRTVSVERPTSVDPPELPPFLQPKRRRGEGPLIIPDILRCDQRSRTQHNNCWTIHYVWMCRVWGFFDKVECAHVNSRRYRQWLETRKMKDDIPPHIVFGGAVVAGEVDPDFYAKWVAHVQETFC